MTAKRPIEYLIGDATQPKVAAHEPWIIANCCNNVGKWGAGFSGAISRKWKAPERVFRNDFRNGRNRLGYTAIVPISGGVATRQAVANIIGQDGIGTDRVRVRYEALREGFKDVRRWCDDNIGHPSVHMPRIGRGLAGGSWEVVEHMIYEEIAAWGVRVCVYDLEGR